MLLAYLACVYSIFTLKVNRILAYILHSVRAVSDFFAFVILRLWKKSTRYFAFVIFSLMQKSGHEKSRLVNCTFHFWIVGMKNSWHGVCRECNFRAMLQCGYEWEWLAFANANANANYSHLSCWMVTIRIYACERERLSFRAVPQRNAPRVTRYTRLNLS